MTGAGDWKLAADERLIHVNSQLAARPIRLVALTRVRNESLVLQDTLDHVSCFADAIVAYDDASTDSTLALLRAHPRVAFVISNRSWKPTVADRLLAETRHRGLLLSLAREHFDHEWNFCFDADERYVGAIRTFVESPESQLIDAVRVRLFDAYLTPGDDRPYLGSRPLLDSRQRFGPERRDILMLWRNRPEVVFEGLDCREPRVIGRQKTDFYCQHYGKALSVEHWESTCDYYVSHFPEEPYGRKWRERKGRAIHEFSDFGRPLYPWGDELFRNSVNIG